MIDIEDLISGKIAEHIGIAQRMLNEPGPREAILKIAEAIVSCYRGDGRVFFLGNGGSAADAQHLATELVSRFYLERKALAAEALTVNSSALTAIGNDYSFDRVYARQVEAAARRGDVVVGISTSGNSGSVLEAISVAAAIGARTVGFTGEKGGKLAERVDLCLKVPSSDTPRIQEGHILAGHIICEIVERQLFA